MTLLPPLRAWSLGAKLVAVVVGLFLVVTVATASLTVVALHHYLRDQLDSGVQASVARAGGRPDLDGDHDPGPGGPPGAGAESLTLVLRDGTAEYSRVAHGREVTTLTDAQVSRLASAGLGRQPVTVDLPGLGAYRVAAGRAPAGDTVVSGLPLQPVTDIVRQVVTLVTGGTIVGLVVVGAGGLWLVRRNLTPLQRVAHTATRVSRQRLDSGDVALAERVSERDTDPRTEVGQVGLALNAMLDNVEGALQARHESEQRVRQFVADASHELRTPLASIRGYAELSRREREPVPASVTHALSRVESEAVRMSALVEDMLLLARLDDGRPLEREPVDLSRLAVDAVSDAHAAAPTHRWELDLPELPVQVSGDRARLHQVVANLLANARTHAPSGTVVTTSLRQVDGWVQVAVHDDGPGVPEALQHNVFQRFTRGDAARVRATGSTGLGLSIVQAVTQAHGGRVELTSAPGSTMFTVLLPASPASPDFPGSM
jgi:two-component system OmpR family sensor kinase